MAENMEILSKILDSEDTTVGGGSAAALAGAMAGALVAMASRLSTAQRVDWNDFYHHVSSQAERLSQQLLQGSQADGQAFQSVRHAYQLPRQTEKEKTIRQEAVQSAWLEAARVPLENAERCMLVFELGAHLTSSVNPKVLSDLRCGILLARAGLLGCLENVYINLPAIKDPAAAQQFATKADALSNRLGDLELTLEPAHPSGDPR